MTWSLQIQTASGECRTLAEISPDDTLYSLRMLVADTFGKFEDDVKLTAGSKVLSPRSCGETKLIELGLSDGTSLTCTFQCDELFLNPKVFRMDGIGPENFLPELLDHVMESYVSDYRLRRQTVAFAKGLASSSARAPYRTVDMPETSGVDEESQLVAKRLVKVGENFSIGRTRPRDLYCDDWDEVRELYDRGRRTTSWAEQVAEERESRFANLVVEGEPGQLCVGSKQLPKDGAKPDASWSPSRWCPRTYSFVECADGTFH